MARVGRLAGNVGQRAELDGGHERDDERGEPVLSTSLSVQPVQVGQGVGHGVVGCLCCRYETVKLTYLGRS